MTLIVVALMAPCAFMIASPAMPRAHAITRTAAADHLLDAKRHQTSLLTFSTRQQDADHQLPVSASGWLTHMRRMLLGLLGWTAFWTSCAEDVLLALAAPETYKLLLEWRKDAFGGEAKIMAALSSAESDLQHLSDPLVTSSVQARSKGLWSTFHKSCMRRQRVHDVLAVRVVVNGDEADCFSALRSIQKLWPESVAGRRKDYINSPKPNGYRAVHDTVILPSGLPLEVQVRTTQMHHHAEVGGAAHRRYKGPAHTLPRKLLEDIASVAALPLPLLWDVPLLPAVL